jgi:hypothetical protein
VTTTVRPRSVALTTIALSASVSALTYAAPDVDMLLGRVGDRIAEYYRRAQNVICVEKSTVQPIGWNLTPDGFARVVESELHVEAEADDGNGPGEAKVVRAIRKVNGRAPRERDNKDRAGCTDPNPLSPEPLAFLLPTHRREYRFVSAGTGKDNDRPALLIDFTSVSRSSKLELSEDRRGHEDCFEWSGDLAIKGRIWIDASTYEVLRVDTNFMGPVDVRVPPALQRRHNFSTWLVVERYNQTIRYKTIAFHDPDETMLLPESIDVLSVMRGGLQSTRRRQTFSDYKRFLTGGRLVK